MKELDTLYELCETLNIELSEYNNKIQNANGKMSMSDLEVIDKLTHSLKSVKTTIAMIEAEDKGYSGHYWDGRYYFDGETSMDGGSSNRGSYRGSYEGGTSGRGRGPGANRDRMGRYAEYSRADAKEDFRSELEELMNKAPDEQSKKKIEKLMHEMN
ncbi:hypothetical protein [Ruminococcus sp.]|uniref:hypothetical protein n=1 Tax=Ruminococcus sp. TaxID=41978 RepID=UPI001B7BAD09|nr:hypothetical protein [Ruminococcus sp.]MBP5432131.1 hypothetical protein [Ruminococcus sp.]